MRALTLAVTLPVLAAVGVAGVVPDADAAVRRVGDGRGNTITFDVRASGVDVNAYARILRNAAHGREIGRVTIRIVPRSTIEAQCGSRDAVACYGGSSRAGTIIVPAGRGDAVRHSLLHEYGHHVDASIRTPAAQRRGGVGDGTPRWWSTRRMAQRVRQGQVSFTYSKGWARAIGEIFAEDYVQLHVAGRYSISWLAPPGAAVLNALRRDITGTASGPAPERGGLTDDPGVGPGAPGRESISFPSAGRIPRGRTVSIPFGLLGSGRSVDFTAELTGLGAPASVRTALICDGRRITGAWGLDDKDARIKRRNLGPADCSITMTNVGESTAAYDADLVLSRPRGG